MQNTMLSGIMKMVVKIGTIYKTEERIQNYSFTNLWKPVQWAI